VGDLFNESSEAGSLSKFCIFPQFYLPNVGLLVCCFIFNKGDIFNWEWELHAIVIIKH
jgi:hypothetical protein